MSSKIKVDTIENVAGSGNVSLGSGHNLVVPGNQTVGGTLGVTGATTTAGITSSAAHTVTTSTHANASVFKSTGHTQIMLQDTDASANDQFWGLQNSGGSFNILTCNDDRANGFVTPFEIKQGGQILNSQQPRFHTEGTNYTQTAGSFSVIIPAAVNINVGSNFNGSTGVFTAPVAGHYVFSFWGLSYPHSTESHTHSVSYYKNNGLHGDQTQFNGTTSGHIQVSGTTMISLAASDTVDLRYQSNASSSAKAWSGQWNMIGYLLG